MVKPYVLNIIAKRPNGPLCANLGAVLRAEPPFSCDVSCIATCIAKVFLSASDSVSSPLALFGLVFNLAISLRYEATTVICLFARSTVWNGNALHLVRFSYPRLKKLPLACPAMSAPIWSAHKDLVKNPRLSASCMTGLSSSKNCRFVWPW